MLRLFVPNKRYAIITGRPKLDETETLFWIHQNLSDNLPIDIYHDRPWIENFDIAKHTLGAAKYKAEVLNEDTLIDVYIESDIEQVKYLQDNVRNTCSILHFETLVVNAINNEVEHQRRIQWQKSF